MVALKDEWRAKKVLSLSVFVIFSDAVMDASSTVLAQTASQLSAFR